MNPNGDIQQPNSQLLQYVHSMLAQGYTMDDIVTAAKNGGWPDEQIETCIAWTHNNYASQKLAINDVFEGHVSSNRRGWFQVFKKVLFILGLLLVLAAAGGGVLYTLNGRDSRESVFEDMILGNLGVSTYQQDHTVKSPEEGYTAQLTSHSDFSDPRNPRSEMGVVLTILVAGDSSSMEISYDIIAIGDDVWTKLTGVEFSFDAGTRALYESIYGSVASYEQSLLESFGVGEEGVWQYYSVDDLTTDSTRLDMSIALTGVVTNSVLGVLPIGDFSDNDSQAAEIILASGVYTFGEDTTTAEQIDGKDYLVYSLELHAEPFQSVNTQLSELLGLSTRHLDLLLEDNENLNAGSFKLWIDPDTRLPKKVMLSRNGETEMQYSHFGDSYSISPPQ